MILFWNWSVFRTKRKNAEVRLIGLAPLHVHYDEPQEIYTIIEVVARKSNRKLNF